MDIHYGVTIFVGLNRSGFDLQDSDANIIYFISDKFKLLVHISTNKRKILIIWVLYIGYSIITMFWSTNFSAAVTNSMSLVLLSLIVLVFFATDLYDEDETNIDKCWIFSGIICTVIYIFGDRTSIGEYGSRTSMTILGTPTDPNEFASIFIVPISLALYELLHKEVRAFCKRFL